MISSDATTIPTDIHTQLTASEWRRQMTDHEQKIRARLDPYLRRRSEQQKDPVMDFLFEYYAFRPSHMRRWSPGLGTLLLGGNAGEWHCGAVRCRGEGGCSEVAG